MSRTLLILALTLLAAPAADLVTADTAWAAPKKKDALPERTGPRDLGDEPLEDFDLGTAPEGPGFLGEFLDEDEPAPARGVIGRKTASAPAPTGPGPIGLDHAGKEPLTDNYPLQVVNVERSAVVVELPVLVAHSSVAVDKPFALIADLFVDDDRVGRTTLLIEPASLTEFGPTFAFLKLMAPVIDKDGRVTVKVSKAQPDGTQAVELFSRTTPYALP